MNRTTELLTQELFLAVLNGNNERAAKLGAQCPYDLLEKIAHGANGLYEFALHRLPAGTAGQIRKTVKDKAEEGEE